MRALLFCAILTVLTIPSEGASSSSRDARLVTPIPVFAMQSGRPPVNDGVDTTVARDSRPWYSGPLRVILGILAVVIFVALIAWAIWGGGMQVGPAGYADRVRSVNSDERLWTPEPRTNDREPTLESRVLARPDRLKE